MSLANNASFAAYKGDEFVEGISVFAVGCPELATLVERGELYGPLAERAVREALQPLLMEDVDVIVLGCTHFPALRSLCKQASSLNVGESYEVGLIGGNAFNAQSFVTGYHAGIVSFDIHFHVFHGLQQGPREFSTCCCTQSGSWELVCYANTVIWL